MAIKIAIITLHWANNYGASLQTFATVKTLSKYGEVSVLDYRNPYTGKGMRWIRFGLRPRDILRISKDIFRLFPRYRVINKFKNFTYKYFNLTKQIIDKNDFEKIEGDFDVFISGSDQIWNPKIVNEDGIIDTHYFLDFVNNKDKKKIAYASSVGTYKYTDLESKQVTTMLNNYNSIAVREEDSSLYLSELINKEVMHVLDPTLLLDKQEWLSCFDINKDTEQRSYILVYALHKDALLKQVVESVSKKLNMEVITIDQDPFTNFKNNQHIKDASPIEFLELFSKANFIVTNSFHGTCFSVNFNIPFITTTPPTSINRIVSLLKAVEAENRIVQRIEELVPIIEEKINFNTVNLKLKSLRSKSLAYLDNAFIR